jgi:RNA polymerase sigma-70 factor (ECF subfamily)
MVQEEEAGASLETLERLYRQRYRRFLRVALAIVGSRETAHEVVQEAFAKAIRGRFEFRGGGSVEGWVWAIAVNQARSVARQAADELITGEGDEQGDDGSAEAWPEVRAAIAALPERQRLVVFLRHYADLPYERIAEILKIERGTVAATRHGRGDIARRARHASTPDERGATMTADLLDQVLDCVVDHCNDAPGDWPDVLKRAGVQRIRHDETEPAPLGTTSAPRSSFTRRFVRRRYALATAAVVAGAVVAAAFATGLAYRFGAWVQGTPGKPAPPGLQHGFESRNRAAYAAFPSGTKLRLLLARRVGNTTFSLLGFRNGDAYCLRLVRADHPNAIGRNECLRAEELSGVPALVAGDAWFRVGDPSKNINGVYGFAADDVRALLIERLHGADRVPVANNVFLSLQGQRAGTVQNHPLPNPVIGVKAVLKTGGTRNVPYVNSGWLGGIVPGGQRPTVPSYFGRAPAATIPGPTKVAAPILHPTIGWLKRHERRGAPLPHVGFSHPSFGRVIQPDPDNPLRIGIAAGEHGALCDYYFAPLAPRSWGGGCGPWFRDGPIRLGSWFDAPIQHFNGFAADGITHITAFLASGRIVQAALRDNVFTVAVSSTELPGRLVGYDAKNRVAGTVELPGNAILRPCPTPKFTTPANRLPRPQPWETVNLGDLTVNGRQILGLTPEEVEAALGKPDGVRPAAQRTNGVAIPAFRYGGQTFNSAGLTIQFSKKGKRIFANSLFFQSPSLVDSQLGHVLRMSPLELQRAIARTYRKEFRVYLSYGSNPSFGCTATLPRRSSPRGITFGINPYRPSRPYLAIRNNAGG